MGWGLGRGPSEHPGVLTVIPKIIIDPFLGGVFFSLPCSWTHLLVFFTCLLPSRWLSGVKKRD